jgi:Oxidoreductase family, NAD-binding Rossmann fold
MPATPGVAIIGDKTRSKARSHAHRTARGFFDLPLVADMRIICGRNAPGAEAAAKRWGWAEAIIDWHGVVERPDIGLMDRASPGATHMPVVVAAAAAGKYMLCEKPLANTVQEARAMVQAAEKAGIIHKVGLNFRRVSAAVFALQVITAYVSSFDPSHFVMYTSVEISACRTSVLIATNRIVPGKRGKHEDGPFISTNPATTRRSSSRLPCSPSRVPCPFNQ